MEGGYFVEYFAMYGWILRGLPRYVFQKEGKTKNRIETMSNIQFLLTKINILLILFYLLHTQGILKRPDRSKRQRPPTAVETMLYINLYALLFLIPIAVSSGQWMEGIRLLKDSEQLRSSLAILNGFVSLGQIFIFLTIIILSVVF